MTDKPEISAADDPEAGLPSPPSGKLTLLLVAAILLVGAAGYVALGELGAVNAASETAANATEAQNTAQ